MYVHIYLQENNACLSVKCINDSHFYELGVQEFSTITNILK